MTKKLLNPLKLRTLPIFVHVMAVARSSSGSLVIRYVFPVLWMTSLAKVARRRPHLKRSAHAALGLATNGTQ